MEGVEDIESVFLPWLVGGGVVGMNGLRYGFTYGFEMGWDTYSKW